MTQGKIVIDKDKFYVDGKFDTNAYMKEYMREKRRLEKEEKNNVDNDIKKPDSINENQDKEKLKENSDSEKIEVSEVKKKKKSSVKLSPESFANFSVSVEKTSLMLRKDKELKPHEQKYIEDASKDFAELYGVPKLLIPANYAFSMALPHINRFIDIKTVKEELEVKKLIEELKRMGVNVSEQELLLMSKDERQNYANTELKKKELAEQKNKALGNSENKDGDILLG